MKYVTIWNKEFQKSKMGIDFIRPSCREFLPRLNLENFTKK